MSSDFEKNLEKYAEVIVKVGLNVQPGQRLLIGQPTIFSGGAPIELAPLIRLITKKAYKAGAKFVEVLWDDDHTRLIRFQNAPRDSFEEVLSWRIDAAVNYGKAGDAVLIIYAVNPDLLSGQDIKLITNMQHAHLKRSKPLSDLRSKVMMNWTVISAPVEGWTEKVYPDHPIEKAKMKFWEAIFDICRMQNEDPVSAWKDHLNKLRLRSDVLNKKKYSSLKLTAPGTDLIIGLPKNHIWRHAGFTSQNGINCVVNIPTEEIFTTPHKNKTEGFVTSTKPLPTGVLIEDFRLTFSEGKVIDATAKKGEEMLLNILETDEGVKQLGEVALVPHSSPISQSGTLFYNVLIDENASCHIALGRGIRNCIEGGETMTEDEFKAAGGNLSIEHVDFMIGSENMNIDGILEKGTDEAIMRNGEWVFEV